ncbi:MAG TPA: hypothetical protein ENN22_04735 [bacterium]|nr:hypothetical protein [bacterium]
MNRIEKLNKFIVSLVLYSALIFAENGTCQAAYVPLNHRLYRFLERAETKHYLRPVLDSTKPLSRMEAAEYLVRLCQQVQNGLRIHTVERAELDYLKFEFQEEVERLNGSAEHYRSRIHQIINSRPLKKILPDLLYRNGKNLLSFEDEQIQIFLDPVYRYRYSATDSSGPADSERNNHFTNGFLIRGYLNKYLGFSLDFRDNKEWGSQKYQLGNYTLPGLGFVRATSPDFIYHDETQAYVKLGISNFGFVYGKFKNYWGSSAGGSMILSDNATSYDQLKLEFKHNKFKFTSIYAALIDYRYSVEDSLQKKKYLAAHRLEVAPFKWLCLGISETVVFKGRVFEPAYFNPVMFFRSAEHYLGSPDNMIIGVDFKLTAVRNVLIYGELIIDDMTTSKLGSNWFGNKYGITGGMVVADPFGLANTDFKVEYTRLRPYVYTHANSINYTHYASSLGHPTGPNSEVLNGVISYRPAWRWLLQAGFTGSRKGLNSGGVNYGGNIEHPWKLSDSLYPEFLDGSRIEFQEINVQISYEIVRGLMFDFRAARATLKRAASADVKTRALSVSLGINY